MGERGIEYWQNWLDPPVHHLHWLDEGLRAGQFRLVETTGGVVGCVRVQDSDPLFWGDDAGPACYVHSLTIDRRLAGRRLGARVLDMIGAECASRGTSLLRLDCGESAAGLRRYYESLGFVGVGDTIVDGERLVLYERHQWRGVTGEAVALTTATDAQVTAACETDPEGNVIELRSWSQATGSVRSRAFRASDAIALEALIHRTIDACYPGAYPPRAVDFFKRHHSMSAILERGSDGDLIVIEHGPRIVATGGRAGCEIRGVFVDPAMQGRGLGARVMDELEAGLLAQGHHIARLDVSLPSRGFYERRGYTVIADRSIDVGEGQRLLYWEAEKPLGGGA